MLTGGFFFGIGALLIARVASTNDRGLILNGLFHFDTHDATIFYWCVAAASAALVAIAFMKVLFGLFSNQYLSLSETELSAPRSLLSLENTIVPLSSIVRLELRTIGKLHFLKVYHGSRKLTIEAANLPDHEAFQTICVLLAERHSGIQREHS